MNYRLDIVLFGASGFTGSYCIESLHKLANSNGSSFTWGIAGRSEQKLRDALEKYQNWIGADLSLIPIITADVNDFKSLKKMTARAKVIINCCGPYTFYGEAVIAACIETGTHQVDVSGEPLYMETIQYKYHKAAHAKGIFIVSACGFDSIPADLGVIFLQDKFNGTVNSIESYVQFFGNGYGAKVNFGTYESAVHSVGSVESIIQLRRKLYPITLPTYQQRLKPRPPVHKSDLINIWCIPFIGVDLSVIQRTQRFLHDNKIRRPVQVQTYLGLQSFANLMLIIILGMLFGFLAKYEFGRTLLLKYPSFFTAGFIKHEKPSKEEHSKTKFVMTLQANGWNKKLSDVADDFNAPPNKTMVARVSGHAPVYTLTATSVTLSAMTILTEGDKLPKSGGVYTPGSAFMETTLIKRLEENGLKFEIL